MAFDLRYRVTGRTPSGSSLRLDIKQENSATAFAGVDAIFATNEILTDTVITGAVVGNTLDVSGSDNNDGQYVITSISLGTGPGLYPNEYFVTETPGTLEEDTSGFTINLWNSQTVKSKPYVFSVKWGEEDTPSGDLHSKFQPIQRAYLTAELKNDIERQYEDMFLEDGWICEAYVNNSIYFYGLLRPQIYSAPFTTAPYFTKVIFSCGLTELGEKRFFIPEADTRQTISEVLAHALSQTGFVLGLYESVNVYQNSFSMGDDDSPLNQATVHPEYWYSQEGTFLDFVQDICELFGARIYQWQGYWYLQRINEFSGEYLRREFDNVGTIVAASGIWIDGTSTVTETNSFSEDEIFTIRKADYVRVEVIEAAEKSYFENSYFEDWTSGVPDHWTNSGLTLTESTEKVTGSKSLQVGSSASSNYLQHDGVVSYLNVDNPSITGTYKFDNPTPLNSEGYMFRYSIKANAYWVDANGSWTNSGEQILDYEDYIWPDTWTDFSISIPVTSHPDGTTVTIIFKLHGGRPVTFDNISFRGVSLNNAEPTGTRSFIYDNDITPGSDGDPSVTVSLKSGVEEVLGTNREHANCITEGLYWERRGISSEERPLPEILLEAIKDESSRNQAVLNLQITQASNVIGHNYSMPFPLKLPNFDNRRFIGNGVTWIAGEGTWKGNFVEIISSPKYSELPMA